MKNNGNECYLNSILQMLFNLEEFNTKIIKNNSLQIIQSYLYSKQEHSNTKIKQELIKFNEDYKQSANNQHDSHEILILLLNLLSTHSQGTGNIYDICKNTWLTDNMFLSMFKLLKTYIKSNSSFVNTLFTGIYLNELVCSNCKELKFSFEIFSNGIILPFENNNLENYQNNNFQQSKDLHLEDLLDTYFHEEILEDVICDKCQQKSNFIKYHHMALLPKYLLIVLKRFDNNFIKNTNIISFSTELCLKETFIYKLNSIINHHGDSLFCGHYTTICIKNEIWTLYNDDIKNIIGPFNNSKDAYIFIYELQR